MTRFVLDSDIVSLLQHGHPVVVENLSKHSSGEVATTIITMEEQLSGWYTLLRRARTVKQLVPVYERMGQTVRFLSRLPLLSFTDASAEVYERLRRQKPRAGSMDLRVAAIALTHSARLVTRNRRDFEDIEDLTTENWAAG